MTLNEHYYAVTESGHAFYVGRFASEDDALDAAIGIVYKRSLDSRVNVYNRAQFLRLGQQMGGLLAYSGYPSTLAHDQ